MFDRPLQAGVVTGDGEGLTRRQQVDLKPVFGDIDADERRYHGGRTGHRVQNGLLGCRGCGLPSAISLSGSALAGD